MKRISAAAVLLIVVSLSAPEAVRAQRTGSFLYHYVDPPVIYFDGSTATRVEVATTGQSIRQVLLTYPELGAMYDDGSHGDRIAGDGIYTLSGVTMRGAAGTMPYYGGTHGAAGFRVKIIKTDGTEQEVTAVTYALVSAGQNFPTLQLADGLYATGSAFFVVDPKGEALDSVIPLGSVRCGRGAYAAFHKLYSVFPDVFDFVVVMPSGSILDPARDYGENTPYFVRAKNEIRNIGVPLFDRTAEFGSQGRLRGMIYHSFGEGAILDHEIGHSWMASFGKRFELSECAQCYGDHWNPYTDIGGQMGAFLLNVPGVAAGHLVANGDGTFRVQQVDQSAQGYSKLDLYLMGLIPSSEVPLVNKLVNPDFSNPQRVTAQRVETYTIQQLVQAEGGERVPAFPTQKDFNLAFVAVKNKAFTPAEFAYFSLVARYFASRERGERYFVPFNAATGGRGALNPNLPAVPARVPVPGILNAASYARTPVAPGEIITVFGSDIGPATLTTLRLTPQGLVDNLLADTRVFFDGVAAPLVFVQANQLSAVVPYHVAGRSSTVLQIEYRGNKSVPVEVPVAPSAPGIFTLDASGRGPGAIRNEDGQVNSAARPAARGSIIEIYATGEGQTNPAGQDGKPALGTPPKPLLQVSVTIGGIPAPEVLYAGGAPENVAGVLQVNVRVPAAAPAGNTVPIQLTIGNASSQSGVTVALR